MMRLSPEQMQLRYAQMRQQNPQMGLVAPSVPQQTSSNVGQVEEMGRGAYVDPEELASREQRINQMLANAIAPQEKEQHWMQGAARLAQALGAGYEKSQIKKERELSNQGRGAEMEMLANAISGGNFDPSAIKRMSPEIQKAYLGAMQNETQYKRQREDKAQDRKENEDPIKAQQRIISELTATANNENVPIKYRNAAKMQIEQASKNISAMKPPSTQVNIDNSQKAQDAGVTEYRKKEGETAAKRDESIVEAGLKAPDRTGNLNQLEESIRSGKISTLSGKKTGQAIQEALSLMNLPNDSASVGNYLKEVNNQALDARQRMKGQGTITNMEAQVAAKTVLIEGEPIESMLAKIEYDKQLRNREELAARLVSSWKEKYGTTLNKAENGKTFDQALQKLIEKNPLKSWEEIAKENEMNASKAQSIKEPK